MKALAIVPVPPKNGAAPNFSIFSGNAGVWNKFFAGFAWDYVGKVTVSRALTVFDVNFAGTLNDIPYWLRTPRVLKIPVQPTTIVKHTYIGERELNAWPEKFIYYNETPEELKRVMSCSARPIGIALPLASVLGNASQVRIFCQWYTQVKVTVLLSSPPIAVFTNGAGEREAFAGSLVPEIITHIEKAFVVGFMELLTKTIGSHVGFKIVPADGCSLATPRVNVVLVEGSFPYFHHGLS